MQNDGQLIEIANTHRVIEGSGANSSQGRGRLCFAALSVRDGVKRRAPHSTVPTWLHCARRAYPS